MTTSNLNEEIYRSFLWTVGVDNSLTAGAIADALEKDVKAYMDEHHCDTYKDAIGKVLMKRLGCNELE